MEVENVLFIVVFIVLPIGIGVWALLSRRELLRGRAPTRRRNVAPSRSDDQMTEPLPEAATDDDQATTQIPQRDWASHVRPVRQASPDFIRPKRRRFYPPRYVGRSGGVVKRVTPRAARSFLRLRSSPGR